MESRWDSEPRGRWALGGNHSPPPPPGRVVAAVLFLNVFSRLLPAPRPLGEPIPRRISGRPSPGESQRDSITPLAFSGNSALRQNFPPASARIGVALASRRVAAAFRRVTLDTPGVALDSRQVDPGDFPAAVSSFSQFLDTRRVEWDMRLVTAAGGRTYLPIRREVFAVWRVVSGGRRRRRHATVRSLDRVSRRGVQGNAPEARRNTACVQNRTRVRHCNAPEAGCDTGDGQCDRGG